MSLTDAYDVLAEQHGCAGSERYRRILEFLMTPRQARLCAQLPMSLQDLVQREDLPIETVRADLDELFFKGVVFARDFYNRETYRFARNVMQLHDASESLWGLDSLYSNQQRQQLWQLWWDFVTNEWDPKRMPQLAQLPAPPVRIVPAYKAIKDIPGVLPHEDMSAMVDAAGLISVVSCSCRKRQEAVGNPCSRSHDMNCIQFNRAAQYTDARGHGKMLSKEEALKLIEEAEDHGLVHQWPNNDSLTTNTLCSCCDDCCIFLLPMREHGVPWTAFYAKSRFEAQNDLDICDGCQDCVERCQFDAITMEKVPGHKKLKAIVDAELCMGCGVCVLVCEPESLKMALVRPPEHIPHMAHAGAGHSHA
jgi:Na+-translocating ferredoxin:NAD+ oxidoreductase subunit B